MVKNIYVWIAALILFFSCNNSPTDSDSLSKTLDTPLKFSDAINVIWHLEEFKIADQQGDAEEFERFTFIIGDSTFVGFDGCNWYGGRYEIEDNKISLFDIGSTEIACNLTVFQCNQLQDTFDLEITTKRLVLSKSDRVLTFSSNATNDVKGSPLIGKIWQVSDSNAPEFRLLKSLDLLPVLEFYENREFRIEWYCSDDNIFGCNERNGFFGLGDNHIILFWEWGGSYAHPAGLENMEDNRFIKRIFKSTFYEINNNVLRLSDERADLFFELSME
jgi:heat shock protein HslJ